MGEKPMCKKCISESMDVMKGQMNKDGDGKESKVNQAAQMLGLQPL